MELPTLSDEALTLYSKLGNEYMLHRVRDLEGALKVGSQVLDDEETMNSLEEWEIKEIKQSQAEALKEHDELVQAMNYAAKTLPAS